MNRNRRRDPGLDERMETELENALKEDDPAEKDYHIRSALQHLVLLEEDTDRR